MSTETKEIAKEVAKDVATAKTVLSKAAAKAKSTKDKSLVEKVANAEKACEDTVKYVASKLNNNNQ